MDSIAAALADVVGRAEDLLPEILAAGFTLVLFGLAGQLFGSGVGRLLRAQRSQNRYARIITRLVRIAFLLVGVVLGLQILGLTAVATSLLATGGLLAVILGFAFREIGENLLAGLFLGVSRSFDVGDLIESSGHIGCVPARASRRGLHPELRRLDGRRSHPGRPVALALRPATQKAFKYVSFTTPVRRSQRGSRGSRRSPVR